MRNDCGTLKTLKPLMYKGCGTAEVAELQIIHIYVCVCAFTFCPQLKYMHSRIKELLQKSSAVPQKV